MKQLRFIGDELRPRGLVEEVSRIEWTKNKRNYSTRYWSIVRDDKTINRLLGFVRNPKESRPTANDIYERNIQAEIEHADYVRACCSPYDCMHNENGERDSGEIWAKIS